MELKIYNPTDDGFVKSIEWNHEEIKAEVKEKLSFYNNLVYTEDQIKDAKTDRAKLNKFITALEDKRKAIKKQCLAPYETFETEMKEIIDLVKEPVNLIDVQISDFEKKKKEEKREKIVELWDSLDKPEWLKLEQLFQDKFLNASCTIKTIEQYFLDGIKDARRNIETLSNLPEFGFEACEVYKTTLDVNRAISEAQRMSAIAKAKKETAEKLEQLKKEEEFAKGMNPPVEATSSKMEQVQQQATSPKFEVKFVAYMTVDEAKELKKFFEDRQIEFKAIWEV